MIRHTLENAGNYSRTRVARCRTLLAMAHHYGWNAPEDKGQAWNLFVRAAREGDWIAQGYISQGLSTPVYAMLSMITIEEVSDECKADWARECEPAIREDIKVRNPFTTELQVGLLELDRDQPQLDSVLRHGLNNSHPWSVLTYWLTHPEDENCRNPATGVCRIGCPQCLMAGLSNAGFYPCMVTIAKSLANESSLERHYRGVALLELAMNGGSTEAAAEWSRIKVETDQASREAYDHVVEVLSTAASLGNPEAVELLAELTGRGYIRFVREAV